MSAVKKPSMNQRKALCMAYGWEYSDAEEYQPGGQSLWRRDVPKAIKVWNVGGGYGVAMKDGTKFPEGLTTHFGEWKKVDSFAGWSVYETFNV